MRIENNLHLGTPKKDGDSISDTLKKMQTSISSEMMDAVKPIQYINGVSDQMIDDSIDKLVCVEMPNTQVLVTCATLKNGTVFVAHAHPGKDGPFTQEILFEEKYWVPSIATK